MNAPKKLALLRLVLLHALAIVVFMPSLDAQTQQAAARIIRQDPDLVRQRIEQSGLSPSEIRIRLGAAGLSPSLLDPFLEPSSDSPTDFSDDIIGAVDLLGVGTQVVEGIAAIPVVTGVAVSPASEVASAPEDGLQLFGLNVFRRSTTQFQPLLSGPVQDDYTVGPGDRMVLILTGDVEFSRELEVTREGLIVLPDVGQISVGNLTMGQLRLVLGQELGESYSGIDVGTTVFSITISRLRTNQIRVIGEVVQPGAYQLVSVATVLNALYAAGGPNENGNLRNVEVRRGGSVAASFDLYKYVLEGNTGNDITLAQGDVVFVPVRGERVTLSGEVTNQAVFEMAKDENLVDLINYAGGLTTPALVGRARITRIVPAADRQVPGFDRTVFDIDLRAALENPASAPILLDGDEVTIFRVRSEIRNTVTLSGSVWSEGSFGYLTGMSAWDLINMGDGLTPEAYLSTAHIVRLNLADSTLSVIPFTLETLADGSPVENPRLREFDALSVFSRADFEPDHSIEVQGAVRNPGSLPRFEGMTVRDAILRSGGLVPVQYSGRAFISRLQPDSTRRIVSLEMPVDSDMIPTVLDTLADYDIIRVPALSTFVDRFPVSISGEVRSATSLDFEEGMTLGNLIVLGGGLTPRADLQIEISRLAELQDRQAGTMATIIQVQVDSTFFLPQDQLRFYFGDADSLSTRPGESDREFELQPYDHVTVRRLPDFKLPIQVSLAGELVYPGTYVLERRDQRLSEVLARAGGLTPEGYAGGLQFYRNGSPVNIELERVLRDSDHRDNLIMLPGDRVVIPRYDPVVLVEGAVHTPSSVLYREGASFDYYVDRAGGYREDANAGHAFLRLANGSTRTKSKFLFFGSAPEPGPGSTITVPAKLDTEGTDLVSLFSGIAQVVVSGVTLAVVLAR